MLVGKHDVLAVGVAVIGLKKKEKEGRRRARHATTVVKCGRENDGP